MTEVNNPITVIEFAYVIKWLPEHLPVSSAYEVEYLPGQHWWSSQREHTVAWFSELAGPGAYNRKSRGLDAKHGYNHLQCAPALLWIAEALGEEPATTASAASEAAGCKAVASQCAAIRKVIPWTRIEKLLHKVSRCQPASDHSTASSSCEHVVDGFEEVTPAEAAALLGMSRQQVRRLMDAGVLPFRMVGTHHRLRVADLRAFDQAERDRQARAMDEFTALENELGLFE